MGLLDSSDAHIPSLSGELVRWDGCLVGGWTRTPIPERPMAYPVRRRGGVQIARQKRRNPWTSGSTAAVADRFLAKRSSSPRDEEICVHVALALHRDNAARLADELASDQLVGRRGHLDRSWNPFRLHATCRLHDISPQVVGELVGSHDPSDDRARIDPDPQADLMAVEPVSFGVVADPKGQVGDG